MADRDAAERFARTRALFDRVVEQPLAQREAMLQQLGAGDADLVARVRRWLLVDAVHDEQLLGATAGSFGGDLVEDRPGDDDDRMARLAAALGDRYQLVEGLGDGGMSRVYRARDLRHGRDVAIKVLDGTHGDSIAAARFADEIQLLARMQHPNILTLFDSGFIDDALFFVTPFVHGGTVRDRLRRNSTLPFDEASAMLDDIAAAVDAAHAEGIVHRDLKPENILMNGTRCVVTDFGIAQLLARAGPRRTAPGLLIGTPAYMSPEQAEGDRTVDTRSDVFSVAAVAYELFTGVAPHRGTTVQAVLASVLMEPPTDPRVLRPGLPVEVARTLLRGLSKRPADRFATAGELARAVRGALEAETRRHADHDPLVSRRRGVVFVSGVATLAMVAWLARGGGSASPAHTASLPARFVLSGLVDQYLGSAVTLTPDGRTLVYTGSANDGRPLLVRQLDAEAPRRLAGTDGASRPVVSPNGALVAFTTTDHRLRIIGVDGAALRDVATAWRFANIAWVNNDTVVVDNDQSLRGLVRIAIRDGATQRVTQVDSTHGENGHVAPMVDTVTRRVFFTIVAGSFGPRTGVGEIGVASVDDTTMPSHHRVGVRGRRPIGVLNGWLLYVGDEGGTINAVRLDPKTSRALGAPVIVLADGRSVHGATLASDGTLVYTRSAFVSRPVLVNVEGVARPVPGVASGSYMNPRFAPSGDRLLVQMATARGTEPRVIDTRTGKTTERPSAPRAVQPTWLGRSNRIAYLTGTPKGLAAVVEAQAADRAPRQIASLAGIFALSGAPDGRSVVFHCVVDGRRQLWTAQVDDSAPPRRLVDDLDPAMMPELSPDQRWVAYVSLRGVREEVIVRPLPGPGAAVQISDSGGTEPVWSPDGTRLYFRRGDALMVAELRAGSTMQLLSRRMLFRGRFDGEMPHRNYDVSPRGDEFVFVAADSAAHADAVFVQRWGQQARDRLRVPPG
jgi:eukaryotic-like serine/threonine-protein kinase